MGVTIPLPELDLPKPAQAPAPDALAEFQRAAQLKTQAAQQQAIAAQTEGQQQQNQMQAMQLKDEQLRRQLAPQFVQKGEDGKVTGFDNEGLYSAMLSNGADPLNIQKMRMSQVEMQKGLIGLGDAQLAHQEKINGELYNSLESIRDINKKTAPATPAAPQAQAQQPAANQGIPPIPMRMPDSNTPPAPAQDIGAAAPGSPESFGAKPSGEAATPTETGLQQAAAGPKPISHEAQLAYQKELMRLSGMGIPIGKLKPVLESESDLDQAEAELGLHKQALSDAKEVATTQEAAGKGAQSQAEAEAAQWKGSDGVFVNLKTGQVIHAGGNPTQQAFQEYIKNGGNPLNFASDQAAREASNPALQAAKIVLAQRTKQAEQVIAQGDPAAAGKLLADGSLTLGELKSRGTTPEFIVQATNAAQQANPGFNPQKAEADLAVAKSPANLAFFGSAKSLTDKGGTLDQLADAAKDIPNGKIPVFNSIADAMEAATGSGPVAKYATILLGVSDDYSKVMGGGQGSDTSRNQALKLAPTSASPEARAASIEGIRGAVGSQINSRIGNNAVLKKMYGDAAQSSAPAAQSKSLSVAAIEQAAKDHGVSVDEATRQAKAAGYTVK